MVTNNTYGGVFEKINDNTRKIGFDSGKNIKSLGSSSEIREKIIGKGYFTLEELSRINTVLGFEELSRETKKDILLRSKISELVSKKERYNRQFGIDLIATDDYIEAVLDNISNSATGMRSVNNFVK
jgi:ATP-dependent Clp protease ATP-binding subunit ClpA